MLFQNTRRLRPVQFIVAFLLTFMMFFGSILPTPVTNASSDTKIVVMLNLEDVTDFTAFDKQMATLKSRGVYGVEVDMWWHHFEPKKQGEYDWSYYKELFGHITKAGLKISPIFSFHQCGGNVGDDCFYPLPEWVWELDDKEQMQYKSESDYYDNEYIAPWYDGAVDLYAGAFASFAANMTEFKSSFEKLHIGLGPAGELRYPSYNFADKWQYPSRGLFQAYSGAAVADFQKKMQVKYTDIEALNSAWGTNLASFTEVQPPANGDDFYAKKVDTTTYGKDFLSWYQSTLENHFTKVIEAAQTALKSYDEIPLSAKIPGIHWQYSNPDAPHSAEHAAGLYDYSRLLDLYQEKGVDLTFTMLEMTNEGNKPKDGEPENYSRPQDLIAKVSELAREKGIALEGENALPVGNAEGFKTIYDVVNDYNYGIFTLLRLQNVVKADGTPTNLLDPFVTTLRLGELPQQRVTINIYDPQKDPNAKVSLVGNTGAMGNWNPTAGAAMKYLGDGHWQTTLNLTATATYEFKANRVDDKNKPVWGADPNLSWTVPYIPGGTAVFKADLQREGQDEQHKHYITGDVTLNGSQPGGTTVSLTDANGNVLTAAFGEEKQSEHGNYGLIAAADADKAHYYFEVPRGTYTLKAANGNHTTQLTILANSQTLSDENLLIDNVPDLQLGDAFTVTKKSFSTTAGVSASVNVAPTPLGSDIANKVVIFMLMDGNKPVGINAVGASGSAAQDVSTFFNVAGGSNYKLKVFVVDAYDISSTTNIGNVLAEPLVLQNK
ncbi:family 14 glycosylhydrolase [Paenibacillus sp. YPG26]|uniref:family 14 glycosylhydrolase n=1 Tax=Paenibacillus sp. YPG26 TaxID=2878915 RepID=UPI00203CD07C|nr:family 14 glycosylhydrolase [Paenibacillus sp. YPG26]USB33179.1 family 14 glycosylhydrolase [Paenibacillus sp. YPG26]